MARSRNNGSDGDNTARIKVVYFEAENVSSDLTGVINAFANAVRNAPVQVIANQPPPPQIEGGRGVKVIDDSTPASETEEEVIEGTVKPSIRRRQTREKKAFAGRPDDSIDWNGDGTQFVPYFKDKNPQDTMKKYLVIAAWFKRHGGKESIDTNIIYNAYRRLNWQVLSDVAQPFHEGLKPRNGYFNTEKGSGNYAITTIGLQRVDDMANGNAGDN